MVREPRRADDVLPPDGLGGPTAWGDASADAAALADSEERFRRTMDDSAVAFGIIGPDGRFLQVNAAFESLLARPRADLLGRSWHEVVHPEDIATEEGMALALQLGERDHYRLVKRYLRPDGSVVHGDLTVSCVRASDGSVAYAIAQIIDVTDRVEALTRLERSDRMLQGMFDNAPVAMGVTTLEGRFVRVNQEMAIFFDRSTDEILSMTWQELSPAELVPGEQELISGLLTGERSSYRLLKGFTGPGDAMRWGLLSVTVMRDDDGVPRYLLGQIVDVTEQQDALAATEGTLASMLDPHVIFSPVMDASGRVVDLVYLRANEAACAYLGHGCDTLLGAGVVELFSPSAVQRVLGWCQSAVDLGRLALDDTQLMREATGEERWFDIRAVRVTDKVSFTWRDVTVQHRAVEDRARREYQYRLLADNATDVIIRSGSTSTIEWVSPSVTEVLGWRIDDVVGQRMPDLMHPEDLARVRSVQRAIFETGGTEGRTTARFRTADGGWRWMSDHGRAILDEDGVIIGGIDSLRDVQAEHEARLALEHRERELRGIVDTLLDPWILLEAVRDQSGRIIDFAYVDANEAACEYNHTTRADLIGSRLLELLPEHGPSGVFDRYAAVVESGAPLAEDDQPFTSPFDGVLRRFDNRAVKVGDGISLMWRDVTERFETRQLLREQADHDLLTGAANRRLLERRMGEVLTREPRRGARVAVLYCDLDHFKDVNDTHGHAVGDEVLAAVADGLRGAVREGDVVARLGGDEFVVVLDGVRDASDAQAVATKIRAAISHPVDAGGITVEPRLSIGIAVGSTGDDSTALLARADHALYAAKQAGRDRAVLDSSTDGVAARD